MVGRRGELRASAGFLSRLLDDGAPGLLVVSGAAGVGKTRLVRELESALPEPVWMTVEAGVGEGADPFGRLLARWCGARPWMEASAARRAVYRFLDSLSLRLQLVPDRLTHLREELFEASPFLELACGLPPRPGSRPSLMEPPALREAVLSAWCSLLSAMSALDRVVLVVENAERLDGEQWRLLRRLLAGCGESGVLFVVTSRGGEAVGRALASAPDGMRRMELTLEGIPRSGLGELVRAVAGSPPGEALLELLWKRTMGVPLPVGQALGYLLESGMAAVSGEGLQLTVPEEEVPGCVRRMVLARAYLAGTQVAGLLQAAAVLGDGLERELLLQVSGMDDEVFAGALDSASSMELLDVRGRSVRFSHETLRSHFLESVEPERLAILHLRAASSLAMRLDGAAPSPWRLLSIGDHLQLAGSWGRAADYLRRAASALAGVYENEAAEAAYRRVVPLLHDTDRAEVELELAELLRDVGDLKGGMEVLGGTVARLDRDRRPGAVYARAATSLASMLCSAGGLERAEELLRRALGIFLEAGDDTGSAAAARHLAVVLRTAGRGREAMEAVERSLALARRSGDSTELSRSLYWAAIAYRNAGDTGRMRECVAEQEELASETDDARMRIKALDSRMRMHICDGLYDEALSVHDELVREAERTGSWAALSTATSKAGIVHLRMGEYESATECFSRCAELAEKSGNVKASCAALGNMAGAAIGMRDHETALKCSTRLVDRASAIGFREGVMSGYARMGHVLVLRRAREAALDCFGTQVELARGIGDTRNLSAGLSSMARVLLDLDRLEQALEASSEALAISRSNGDGHLLSTQLELQGRLLVHAGRPGEAEPLLREAVEALTGRRGREEHLSRALVHLHFARVVSGDRGAVESMGELLEETELEGEALVEALWLHWTATSDPGSRESALRELDLPGAAASPLLRRLRREMRAEEEGEARPEPEGCYTPPGNWRGEEGP